MKTTIIAAMDQARGLGCDNALLCHIPEDMAWFKKRTLHKPVVMGRKTAQSLRGPLPHRLNIVLTRQGDLRQSSARLSSGERSSDAPNVPDVPPSSGFVYVSSLDQAKQLAHSYIQTHPLSKDFPAEEMMVIGGAEIYRLFLPEAFSLVLTHMEHTFRADAFFPEFEKDFVLTSNRKVPVRCPKSNLSFDCRFSTYHRA